MTGMDIRRNTLKKIIVLIVLAAVGIFFSPLNGLAEGARPLTLLYTGNIEGKINPIPQ